MNRFEKAREFNQRKNELAAKIITQISPLLEGLNHTQVYLVFETVREKIDGSVFFIPDYQETPRTKHQSSS